MAAYLTFIGGMNLLGVVLLLGALSERFADGLVRRWTQILPADAPYTHSPYGRIWLWWAAIGTGFFAVFNLVAAGWPPEYARTVVYGDVYAYFAFEALAIAGTISGRYGRGLLAAHALWIGQGGWGVVVALERG